MTSLASVKMVGAGLDACAQRVDLEPLAVIDRSRDVGAVVTLEIRTEQHVAAKRVRLQRDVAVGRLVCVTRRQDQILAALAFVGAEQPGIFERHLPHVDDVGVERSVSIAGRQVENDRAILGIEERHEVDRVRIGRERLIAPVERPAPIDDLVHLAVRLAEHFLQHQVVIDRRHAPDHGFNGAALGGTLRELIGCRCLCESRLRDHRGKCDGRDHELLHLSLPIFGRKDCLPVLLHVDECPAARFGLIQRFRRSLATLGSLVTMIWVLCCA